MTYTNLVLSGGAFKASVFIGCIKYLEERDEMKHIANIVGSSAGSIVGLFICLGYSWKEMRDFAALEAAEFSKKEVDIENLFDIFDTLGIDDGTDIVKVFERIFAFKSIDHDMTFDQLVTQFGINLVICGSCLTTASVAYFN
jgi:predicted acylesterase/phospholipase RssA